MTKKSNKEFIKIGVVLKSHGIKGDLFIRPFSIDSSWPIKLNEIFIGEDFISYEVNQYKVHKNGFIFKLKDLNHIDQSEELKGKFVYLPKDLFFSQKDESIYLSEIQGFHLEVLNKGLVGTVSAFQSTKFQDYLLIERPGSKELLTIPFVQNYIRNIDFLKKKILMSLPEDFPGVFND